VAYKKIPNFDFEKKELMLPEKENGFKFEMFVFDVFALAERMVVMEVVRANEFLPLKNKDGTVDSNPTTCREGISNMHKKYLRAAGVELTGEGLCEISPLVSFAGEGLEMLKGKSIALPCHITQEFLSKL
jgi:UDP-N-acetylglucosamine/UDP-N-acetylgalactosamine diphosphorylase